MSDSCHPLHTHTKLDRFGIWLSSICAVHCIVMPFILLLFPVMMKWAHLSRMTDVIVMLIAAVFALFGCILSIRHHKNERPLCLVIIGLVINLTGRFGLNVFGPWLSQTLVIAGPMLMAYGLWVDRNLCKCFLKH